MAPFAALDCSATVYRTVFRKEWIRPNGQLKWQVFKPYQRDTNGVSTFMRPNDIQEHCEEGSFFGIASVKVGRVRDCSSAECVLDVAQNEIWHANITGIPFPYTPDGTEDAALKEKMMEYCTAINLHAARPFDHE